MSDLKEPLAQSARLKEESGTVMCIRPYECRSPYACRSIGRCGDTLTPKQDAAFFGYGSSPTSPKRRFGGIERAKHQANEVSGS
jgi:hypothetical protein